MSILVNALQSKKQENPRGTTGFVSKNIDTLGFPAQTFSKRSLGALSDTWNQFSRLKTDSTILGSASRYLSVQKARESKEYNRSHAQKNETLGLPAQTFSKRNLRALSITWTYVHALLPTRLSLAVLVGNLQSKKQENPMSTTGVMPKTWIHLDIQPRLPVTRTWEPFRTLEANSHALWLTDYLWQCSWMLFSPKSKRIQCVQPEWCSKRWMLVTASPDLQ